MFQIVACETGQGVTLCGIHSDKYGYAQFDRMTDDLAKPCALGFALPELVEIKKVGRGIKALIDNATCN